MRQRSTSLRSAIAAVAVALVGCNEPAASPAVDLAPRLDLARDTAAADQRARDREGGEPAAVDASSERPREASPDQQLGPCPAGMTHFVGAKGGTCIDRHEAPNQAGAQPLVMYTFVEAEAWCVARAKRLCFDDEWTLACATSAGLSYPYGATHKPGVCNDDKPWKVYDQSKLNGWPASASTTTIGDLASLLAAARAKGAAATAAADHVEQLYQATPSGSKIGCTNALGAFDLCGNVEEWTRRRDGGTASFHGNLKGRYWAEARTCQSGVLTHGDGFRFYEIGFRCCRDPL